MPNGQAKISDALFSVIGVAIFVYIMFIFISNQFEDLVKEIALESAETVAKDVAGFVTISGAAPEEIKITYNPSTKFSYDVEIKNRIVMIKSQLDGDYTEGPRIIIWELEPLPWKEKTAIDAIANFKDTKTIVIEKSVEGGKYVYSVTKG